MWRRLEQTRSRMELAGSRLMTVGPQATLQRGYAIVRKSDDSIVRRVKQVDVGERLEVRVGDGAFDVEVVNSTDS